MNVYKKEFENFMEWLLLVNLDLPDSPLFSKRPNNYYAWEHHNYKLFIETLINKDWEYEDFDSIDMYIDSSISEYLAYDNPLPYESFPIPKVTKIIHDYKPLEKILTEYFKKKLYGLIILHTKEGDEN